MPPAVKDLEEGDRYWTVVVRRGHEFDSLDESFVSPRRLDAVAQGAKVRLGLQDDGTHRVAEVQIPAAPFRDEEHVRELASDVTEHIES